MFERRFSTQCAPPAVIAVTAPVLVMCLACLSPAFGRYVRVMTAAGSVLLDLDGTLIDSQPGILASCLAALRALGHEPHETLDIRGAIGPPLEDVMRGLLQAYGDCQSR
jgi:hypothetical protein